MKCTVRTFLRFGDLVLGMLSELCGKSSNYYVSCPLPLRLECVSRFTSYFHRRSIVEYTSKYNKYPLLALHSSQRLSSSNQSRERLGQFSKDSSLFQFIGIDWSSTHVSFLSTWSSSFPFEDQYWNQIWYLQEICSESRLLGPLHLRLLAMFYFYTQSVFYKFHMVCLFIQTICSINGQTASLSANSEYVWHGCTVSLIIAPFRRTKCVNFVPFITQWRPKSTSLSDAQYIMRSEGGSKTRGKLIYSLKKSFSKMHGPVS